MPLFKPLMAFLSRPLLLNVFFDELLQLSTVIQINALHGVKIPFHGSTTGAGDMGNDECGGFLIGLNGDGARFEAGTCRDASISAVLL